VKITRPSGQGQCCCCRWAAQCHHAGTGTAFARCAAYLRRMFDPVKRARILAISSAARPGAIMGDAHHPHLLTKRDLSRISPKFPDTSDTPRRSAVSRKILPVGGCIFQDRRRRTRRGIFNLDRGSPRPVSCVASGAGARHRTKPCRRCPRQGAWIWSVLPSQLRRADRGTSRPTETGISSRGFGRFGLPTGRPFLPKPAPNLPGHAAQVPSCQVLCGRFSLNWTPSP